MQSIQISTELLLTVSMVFGPMTDFELYHKLISLIIYHQTHSFSIPCFGLDIIVAGPVNNRSDEEKEPQSALRLVNLLCLVSVQIGINCHVPLKDMIHVQFSIPDKLLLRDCA